MPDLHTDPIHRQIVAIPLGASVSLDTPFHDDRKPVTQDFLGSLAGGRLVHANGGSHIARS